MAWYDSPEGIARWMLNHPGQHPVQHLQQVLADPQSRTRWQAANPGVSPGEALSSAAAAFPQAAQEYGQQHREREQRQFRSTSFYEQAKAMFPGLPDWIIGDYARGLAEYPGQPALAWAKVREDARYDKTFAGNRREDGSLRMSELEYLATKDAYQQTLRDYGLNPQMFAGKFATLIEGDVSPQEFNSRLDTVWQGIQNNTPEVQAAFQEWYGAAYNPQLAKDKPSVALAMALDPEVGQAVLGRRVTMAQISGEAERAGFDRNRQESRRLANLGVDQSQARQIYSQAAMQLPSLATFSQRFNDDDLFDLSDFEDAALGDAGQQQRAQRLLQAEQSTFSGSRRVAQDQTGGLVGLTQR